MPEGREAVEAQSDRVSSAFFRPPSDRRIAALEERQAEIEGRIAVVENDMSEIRTALAETATRADIFAAEERLLGAIGGARWRASALFLVMAMLAVTALIAAVGLGALRP